METLDFSANIYQIRVWLRKISPMIWRRLLIRGDSTIADLHYTLQIAMGWSDYHLHRFYIHGKEYGISRICGVCFSDDPEEVKLDQFCFRPKEKFIYEYDFTDQWIHEIRVEELVPFDRKRTYPVCIGGARAGPPEDCGGPWAFMALQQKYSKWEIVERFLEMVVDDTVEENWEIIERYGNWLNLERFDRRPVNRRLKQYAHGDESWRYEYEDEIPNYYRI